MGRVSGRRSSLARPPGFVAFSASRSDPNLKAWCRPQMRSSKFVSALKQPAGNETGSARKTAGEALSARRSEK